MIRALGRARMGPFNLNLSWHVMRLPVVNDAGMCHGVVCRAVGMGTKYMCITLVTASLPS